MRSAVLIHGFAGSRASVLPVGDVLRANGIHVEVPLLPGHETSWRALASSRWQEWADCVRSAVDAASHHGPVSLFGISMGGALALLSAAETDRVTAVQLVNPSLTLRNPLLPLLPVLKHVVPSIANNGRQVLDPGVAYRAYDRIPLAAVDEMRKLWREVIPRLSSVHQPVLNFRSVADGDAGLQNSRLIRTSVSSRFEEVVLHRSGHIATLDFDGPQIAERVVADVLAAY